MEFTERDQEVLDYIRAYQQEHRYSPSIREIAKDLYISKTTAQRRLYRLLEMGHISMMPRIPRSIVLHFVVGPNTPE